MVTASDVSWRVMSGIEVHPMMHENSEPNFGFITVAVLCDWGPGDKVEHVFIAGKYRVLRHIRCSLWCSIYHSAL